MERFLKKNQFIVTLLLLVFFLRVPSLLEPYWYGDEGVYLVLGQAINKGLLLYRDIFDNKPPLLYLLAAVGGGTIFWFRFILLASVLPTIYLFFRLCQRLFGEKEKATKIATIIFALLTTFRLVEGTIANAEIFILLPTVAGFYLVFKLLEEKIKNSWKFLVTGLVLSLALLLKIPALFDFAVIFIFLLFFQEKDKIISLGKKEILLLVGYLLPLLATALFFWLKGAFEPFFAACFRQPFGYLFSWSTGSYAFSFASLFKSDLLIRGGLLCLGLGLLWLGRKKLSSLVILVSLWFLLALFGATLSGRPYPHYLIQVIPPFSLAVSLLFAKKEKWVRALVGGLVILLALTIFRYRFWSYATFPYYLNFLQFATGQKDKVAYFNYFDPQVPQIYELAQFINENTPPQERIFIWSDEPQLYALARRLPVGPYTVAYHIKDLHQEKMIFSLLQTQRPIMVGISHQAPPFPELNEWVNQNYRTIKQTTDFTLWQRRTRL